MKREILSSSLSKTKKVGRIIGEEILKKDKNVFIALYGDLGSGKTSFLQGLAKGLGVSDNIVSPTFLICKKYKTKKNNNFYHLDVYRITDKDLTVLNFKDIIDEEKGVVAVEWSENIEKSIPKKKIKIEFSFLSPKERRLIVEDNSGIITDKSLSNM